MKKILTAAALAATLPQAASALPLVDLYAGAYYWDQTVSGDVGTSVKADLEADLNLDAGGQNVMYVAFEHPVPLIPNVKIKSTAMESDGTGSLDAGFALGGTAPAGAPAASVASKLDLTHTDYTFYWSLPLPIVTFDFGLTARQFDGSMAMSGDYVASAPLDVTVPMGYVKAGVDIPLTGLSLGADINTISYGDTGITDFDANMTYVLPLIPLLDVGISAGYRSFDLEINPDDFGGSSSDLSAKAKVAGPYLGISLHL